MRIVDNRELAIATTKPAPVSASAPASAFAADCGHWLGYKPCQPQQASGRPTCAGCSDYQPTPAPAAAVATRSAGRFEPASLATATRVGVLEMGGLGSHLRTSAVTGALRRLNPAAEILWFTHAAGADLLRYVPGVTAVDIESQPVDLAVVQALEVLLNFEISPIAAQLCAASRQVGGFALNPQGRLAPASAHAERLQRLQIDNAYRREFTGSMQEVLLEAVGLDRAGLDSAELDAADGVQGYDLALPAGAVEGGRRTVAAAFGGTAPGTVIGLNVGSSTRGSLKRWPAASWAALARLLDAAHSDRDDDRGVLILSGPEDAETRDQVAAGLGAASQRIPMVDGLEVGAFLSVVGHLQLLVTADTFALHAARAQQVPVLALVGPMPHRELELGPADRIIGPMLPCAPCYYHCSRPILGDCMRRIPVRKVAAQAEELLSGAAPGPPPAGPSGSCRLRPGSYRGTGGAPRSARREP